MHTSAPLLITITPSCRPRKAATTIHRHLFAAFHRLLMSRTFELSNCHRSVLVRAFVTLVSEFAVSKSTSIVDSALPNATELNPQLDHAKPVLAIAIGTLSIGGCHRRSEFNANRSISAAISDTKGATILFYLIPAPSQVVARCLRQTSTSDMVYYSS